MIVLLYCIEFLFILGADSVWGVQVGYHYFDSKQRYWNLIGCGNCLIDVACQLSKQRCATPPAHQIKPFSNKHIFIG